MLDIEVRKNSIYNEITITDNNLKFYLGLFDEVESIQMACDFIIAAEKLLPADYYVTEDALSVIREDLQPITAPHA